MWRSIFVVLAGAMLAACGGTISLTEAGGKVLVTPVPAVVKDCEYMGAVEGNDHASTGGIARGNALWSLMNQAAAMGAEMERQAITPALKPAVDKSLIRIAHIDDDRCSHARGHSCNSGLPAGQRSHAVVFLFSNCIPTFPYFIVGHWFAIRLLSLGRRFDPVSGSM